MKVIRLITGSEYTHFRLVRAQLADFVKA